MNPFNFEPKIPRVVFGAGSLQFLTREIDAMQTRRALVLSTPEQAAQAKLIAQILGDRAVGIFPKAVMHVPLELAEEARREANRLDADCMVAIGGGSTIGLGKAIALESGLPTLAIPTTYAGSEMTPIYGLTEASMKRTGRDARVLPRTVIYDPELTLSLPFRMTASSGLNAIAHAAESLYAHDGNPVTALMAEEGIRAISAALDPLHKNPSDITARSDALYGSWLCGTVLGAVSIGLHHKLCHTLGGTFNLPHSELHAVVLPHALAYNSAGAPQALARIARALGVQNAPIRLHELLHRYDLPVSLAELGMPREGIDLAANLAVKSPYPNPQPLEEEQIRKLLERAYEGAAPD
ncbi:Maleylacetate reductase [Paraburkholderia aspalathi]|uniref:maleylacetate reductase n=1 Tax=Paraburkholderia aspalathi TaxID=1324617 RepID=UPI001B200EFB|nr:maleylacetate reductase [Paraburkholderia aspalathi]CAE6824435.1 Maleylacetate reductase [Paraburkholderia aspalathi]